MRPSEAGRSRTDHRLRPSLGSARGSAGRPSISTRCKPTPRRGKRRARSTASPAADAVTIKLAEVRMPPVWPSSTASFTGTAKPKSSAVTINRFGTIPRIWLGDDRERADRGASDISNALQGRNSATRASARTLLQKSQIGLGSLPVALSHDSRGLQSLCTLLDRRQSILN